MSIEKLTQQPLTIGVELPLDNDWSTSGQLKRQRDGRPFGVPDMSEHAERIKLADTLGFRAAWIRDVPLYDPQFGDAANVFEAFTYLGYLSSLTQNILLGTAAVVLPLRQPWLVRKAAATVQALSGTDCYWASPAATGRSNTRYLVKTTPAAASVSVTA